MSIALIGPTSAFIDALYPQINHIQAFRWYWSCRGVNVKTNGQRFDMRGNRIDPSKTLEQAAREYGR